MSYPPENYPSAIVALTVFAISSAFGTALLVGTGLLGLAAARRRK